MAGLPIQAAAVCYRLGENDPKGSMVRKILKDRDIRIIEVTENDLSQKIGYLVGAAGYEKETVKRTGNAADAPTEPFLLMCFFTKELFDGFLADMKSAGVYIPLKGMLTPTNINWRLGDLIEEIGREHAHFISLQKK